MSKTEAGMITPPAFSKMGVWFDPGFRDAIPPHQDIFSFALTELDAEERRTVKRFLIDVLANVRDPAELQRIWREARSRSYIPDDAHLRTFLREIVNRIEEE